MLSEELIKKVKFIEITTRRRVESFMSGRFKSHFKGHGMQFSEHRIYVPGDDVRHMDWRVTARSREPLIKKFEEERELTVLLLVDVSASKNFGSNEKLKSEIAAEIGGMLTYAATRTGDKVGVLLFSEDIEKIIPPKKGRAHILRVIRDLLTFEPQKKKTDLAKALEAAFHIMKHSGVIFIISDFMTSGYELFLKKLSLKHDVIAIVIEDQREKQMPELGRLCVFNPEIGQENLVDTGSYVFKEWFKEYQLNFEKEKAHIFKSKKMEYLKVLTHEDYGNAVVKFFRTRKRY
ncbi:MAG: DUF58 domain-containing protein [Bdellovibrio sp.]|nr:DUF58 domain-containing protein [Bdellovibrio sp.]